MHTSPSIVEQHTHAPVLHDPQDQLGHVDVETAVGRYKKAVADNGLSLALVRDAVGLGALHAQAYPAVLREEVPSEYTYAPAISELMGPALTVSSVPYHRVQGEDAVTAMLRSLYGASRTAAGMRESLNGHTPEWDREDAREVAQTLTAAGQLHKRLLMVARTIQDAQDAVTPRAPVPARAFLTRAANRMRSPKVPSSGPEPLVVTVASDQGLRVDEVETSAVQTASLLAAMGSVIVSARLLDEVMRASHKGHMSQALFRLYLQQEELLGEYMRTGVFMPSQSTAYLRNVVKQARNVTMPTPGLTLGLRNVSDWSQVVRRLTSLAAPATEQYLLDEEPSKMSRYGVGALLSGGLAREGADTGPSDSVRTEATAQTEVLRAALEEIWRPFSPTDEELRSSPVWALSDPVLNGYDAYEDTQGSVTLPYLGDEQRLSWILGMLHGLPGAVTGRTPRTVHEEFAGYLTRERHLLDRLEPILEQEDVPEARLAFATEWLMQHFRTLGLLLPNMVSGEEAQPYVSALQLLFGDASETETASAADSADLSSGTTPAASGADPTAEAGTAMTDVEELFVSPMASLDVRVFPRSADTFARVKRDLSEQIQRIRPEVADEVEWWRIELLDALAQQFGLPVYKLEPEDGFKRLYPWCAVIAPAQGHEHGITVIESPLDSATYVIQNEYPKHWIDMVTLFRPMAARFLGARAIIHPNTILPQEERQALHRESVWAVLREYGVEVE